MQDKKDQTQFQKKVRVRACGLLIRDGHVLLLKHEGIGSAGFLWSPPGGGVQFGEQAAAAVKREFAEEVQLEVKVEDYLFTNEYIDKKHHAIELFYKVTNAHDEPQLGLDPELSQHQQSISDVRFFNERQLREIDPAHKHNIFHENDQITARLDQKGFYFYNNI